MGYFGAVILFLWQNPPSPSDRGHRLTRAFGSSAARELIMPWEERFGVVLHEVYGSTEIGLGSGLGPGFPRKLGTMGMPCRQVEVAIVDENDNPVPPGQVGESIWRPKEPFAFFQGYWNLPQATVDATRNLWYHSGDAAYIDEDGFFVFKDRIKDTIRRRGENISSFEVELAARAEPGVVECAAYAVHAEDAPTEEEVMIAVVPSTDAPPDPEVLFRRSAPRCPASRCRATSASSTRSRRPPRSASRSSSSGTTASRPTRSTARHSAYFPPRNEETKSVSETRLAYRTCPLCEATCGLALDIEGDRVVKVRGDADDVFSRGYICPKGASIGELHADPDRLPHRRCAGATASSHEATWDEAFAEIERLLAPILERTAPTRSRVYLGNPNAHTLGGMLYLRALLKAIGTRNIFTASTVDQQPKQIASGADVRLAAHRSRSPTSIAPIYMLILGANPLVSNGWLMTAPDMRGRLRGDPRRAAARWSSSIPRRTRTAGRPTSTTSSGPGRDALLLAGDGPHAVRRAARRPAATWTSTSRASTRCGVAAPFSPGARRGRLRHRRPTRSAAIARELAARRAAAVYGRIGTTTQEFGTAGELAGRRAQHADREPRPPGRRACSRSPPPAGRHSPAAGARAAASRRGAGTAGYAGCPRSSASCPSPASPRRSTRPATGRCGR